jgi:hypothetical protein
LPEILAKLACWLCWLYWLAVLAAWLTWLCWLSSYIGCVAMLNSIPGCLSWICWLVMLAMLPDSLFVYDAWLAKLALLSVSRLCWLSWSNICSRYAVWINSLVILALLVCYAGWL